MVAVSLTSSFVRYLLAQALNTSHAPPEPRPSAHDYFADADCLIGSLDKKVGPINVTGRSDEAK